MNNNLYQWHDEQMVKYEMQEVRHAAEQERLLKEACLSKPGLLARTARALRNWLESRRKRTQEPAFPGREGYQPGREQARDPLCDSGQSTD
jgi:hypothetical protein